MTFQFSFALDNPITGTLVGGTLQASVDRFGQLYVGWSGNIGKSATVASASLTSGILLNGGRGFSSHDTEAFLTGRTVGLAGGGIGSIGHVQSPGSKMSAYEVGLTTPQLGVSATNSTKLPFSLRSIFGLPACK